MCLAIPGQITETWTDEQLGPMARVAYGPVHREASLALMPEVAPGQWVLVHAGCAIQSLDEDEAHRTLEAWQDVEDAADPESMAP